MNEPKPQPRDIMSETPRVDKLLDSQNRRSMQVTPAIIAFARQLERELRAAEESCIRSAADKTFIRGGDIPNTIEAARIALLKRCEIAERSLTQAQARCAEARNAALEKAARICESLAIPDGITDCVPYWECAKAIRALKEPR